jgi:hypothetical protein
MISQKEVAHAMATSSFDSVRKQNSAMKFYIAAFGSPCRRLTNTAEIGVERVLH